MAVLWACDSTRDEQAGGAQLDYRSQRVEDSSPKIGDLPDPVVTTTGHRLSEWRGRELGVGVIGYPIPDGYPPEGVVRSAPSQVSDTIATFGEARLCFEASGECGRLLGHLVEYDYEISSWAILGFNADSSWVEVSLDPFGEVEPPTGWIQMSAKMQPLLWSGLLPEEWLFFIWPDSIEFFEGPSRSNTVMLELESEIGPDRYDYLLRPLEQRGRWMKVEAVTPSPLCPLEDSIDFRRDTVWIEYLTRTERPRAFFYTRGC